MYRVDIGDRSVVCVGSCCKRVYTFAWFFLLFLSYYAKYGNMAIDADFVD